MQHVNAHLLTMRPFSAVTVEPGNGCQHVQQAAGKTGRVQGGRENTKSEGAGRVLFEYGRQVRYGKGYFLARVGAGRVPRVCVSLNDYLEGCWGVLQRA